jgi:hypothetical protein
MIARHFVKLCFTSALAGVVGACVAFAQSASATLNGTVADQDGKSMGAAQVRYQRLPAMVKDLKGRWHEAPGEPYVNGAASTDGSGSYAMTQLPAGNYALCVSAPGYLATCDWGLSHKVAIADGQQLNFGAIALAKATTVTIRINDPHQLVQSTATLAPQFALGIVGYGRKFHPAQQVSSDSGGRTFQVDVPAGRSLDVWFQSPRYRVTNSSGTPLNSAGAAIPFVTAAGGLGPTITITVTGTLP